MRASTCVAIRLHGCIPSKVPISSIAAAPASAPSRHTTTSVGTSTAVARDRRTDDADIPASPWKHRVHVFAEGPKDHLTARRTGSETSRQPGQAGQSTRSKAGLRALLVRARSSRLRIKGDRTVSPWWPEATHGKGETPSYLGLGPVDDLEVMWQKWPHDVASLLGGQGYSAPRYFRPRASLRPVEQKHHGSGSQDLGCYLRGGLLRPAYDLVNWGFANDRRFSLFVDDGQGDSRPPVAVGVAVSRLVAMLNSATRWRLSSIRLRGILRPYGRNADVQSS